MSRTIEGLKQCPSCGDHYGASVCPKCGPAIGMKAETALSQVFDDAADFTEEKKLQAKAVEYLLLNGAVAMIWHATNKPTTCAPGVSDIVCLFRKTFIAAEAKIGANKATKAQQDFIDSVNANGGRGFVFTSVEMLKSKLEGIG